MKLAKDYKAFFNSLPDNTPVAFGDNPDCDIVAWRYDTSKGYIELILTEGWSIATDDFINTMFKLAQK